MTSHLIRLNYAIKIKNTENIKINCLISTLTMHDIAETCNNLYYLENNRFKNE